MYRPLFESAAPFVQPADPFTGGLWPWLLSPAFQRGGRSRVRGLSGRIPEPNARAVAVRFIEKIYALHLEGGSYDTQSLRVQRPQALLKVGDRLLSNLSAFSQIPLR